MVNNEVLPMISKVLNSGWLTHGPETKKFEENFSRYIGCNFGVATSSCTAATYLTLKALGIGKGDKVVTPVMTFVSTANVVRWAGAEPVFCDVKEDGNIDVKRLKEILESTKDIKAIIPVHLYGLPCDIEEVVILARENGVYVIEDCAHAPGATFEGKKVGGFGDAGCFSFYATKNITTGEGGMVVTDSELIATRVRHLSSHCQTKSPAEKALDWAYDVDELGFNFRMSEIQAAIGLYQLKKIEGLIRERRKLAMKYAKSLSKIRGIKVSSEPPEKRHVYHLFVIQVLKDLGISRDLLWRVLKENGIVTGVHYPPLHYLTYYKRTTNYKQGDFPVAESLFTKILSIPMYPNMTKEEFSKVISAIASAPSRQ